MGVVASMGSSMVSARLPAQVAKTQPDAWLGGLRSGASYAKGLWLRLNGSPSDGGQSTSIILASLPRPSQPSAQLRASSIASRSQEIASLEKQLQETSKVPHTVCNRWLTFYQLCSARLQHSSWALLQQSLVQGCVR